MTSRLRLLNEAPKMGVFTHEKRLGILGDSTYQKTLNIFNRPAGNWVFLSSTFILCIG